MDEETTTAIRAAIVVVASSSLDDGRMLLTKTISRESRSYAALSGKHSIGSCKLHNPEDIMYHSFFHRTVLKSH